MAATDPSTPDSPLDRGYVSGRSTRELLVRTAERLFAERGIGAVSLREIGQAAGQRNNAATQYHFGTRENLLVAIYLHRAASINARRRELLAHLAATDRLGDPAELLRAILQPHAESLTDDDDHFVGYLARVLTDEARLDIVASDEVGRHLDALDELEDRLRDQFPTLGDDQFDARYDLVFSWAIHAFAEYRRAHPRPNRHEVDAMFDDLVLMLTNALSAADAGARGTGGPAVGTAATSRRARRGHRPPGSR
jgi:AcrR family transcriptional regulator